MTQTFFRKSFLAVLVSFGIDSAALALQTERAFTPVSRYDIDGRVTGTIAPDPDGSGPLKYAATRNTYDARGLLAKTESGELSAWLNEIVAPKDWGNSAAFTVLASTEYAYDDYGRKTTERTRGTNGTIEALVQFSYVTRNLVQCRAVRMNPDAFASPPGNACALGPEGQFGPDRITRYGYDALDQLLSEERAVGVAGLQEAYLTNTYNHRLLGSQTDANGNRTELRYDGYGRLKRRVYPSLGTSGVVNENDYNEFIFDASGNLKVERKRDGRTITTDYDGNNRPLHKDLSDNTYSPDVFYDYDLRGLALYARYGSDTGQGETLTYDGFGSLLTRTTNLGGTARQLRYSYDANANRFRITHPDEYFFTYSFDGLNRVDSARSSDAPVATTASTGLLTVTYARDGRRSGIARLAGATTSYARDNALRLERFSQGFASSADSLANVFSYNPASQVVRLTQSNDQYNFREVANRTGAYLPNGLNQYASINGQAIQYDANGNLTSDGELTYTYDMENRLVSASGVVGGASVNAALTWDPNGRLHQLTVNGSATQFLYDGDALVAEYENGAVQRRYVHGDQVDEPWVQYNGAGTTLVARRFLLADHQGSIIAHADNAGAILNKLAYDSYGIPAAGNVDRFGYTGQAWIKQLGLYHYKARMYHPKLGRFLQTDPIGYRDDTNLYAYVGSDPANQTDPTGECPWCVGALIGAVVDIAIQVSSSMASGQSLGEAASNIDLMSVAVSAVLGAGGNIGGARALTSSVKVLNNATKGKIGEAVTRVGVALRGERVIARGEKAGEVAQLGKLSGRAANAKPDFVVLDKSGAVQVVESKFGAGKLTDAQSELKSVLGDVFSVSRTTYQEVGAVGGNAASIAGGVAGNCVGGGAGPCGK